MIMDAEEFSLDILIVLSRKLTALIVKETNFLRQMKISEIGKLQDEKHMVATILERQQRFLKSDPSIRTNLSADDKTILRQVATEFDAAIHDYQQQLFKAQKVNSMIIEKMVDIVKDHVTKNRSYNNKGTKVANGTELAQNTPAIKYNAQV